MSLYQWHAWIHKFGIWKNLVPCALQTGKRKQVYNDYDQICQMKISSCAV